VRRRLRFCRSVCELCPESSENTATLHEAAPDPTSSVLLFLQRLLQNNVEPPDTNHYEKNLPPPEKGELSPGSSLFSFALCVREFGRDLTGTADMIPVVSA
jgi:hypothetical protein